MPDEDKESVSGVNISGSGKISIGGDVVGRDKIVRGDQVHRDKIDGDKITTGDVSGEAVAIGRGASASAQHGVDAQALSELFKSIYAQIEARPKDPNVDKSEVADTVKKVEEEAARGERANPNKVERWLKTLAMTAPDILDVTVKTLVNPVAGVAEVIRKIAIKAKEEASPTR